MINTKVCIAFEMKDANEAAKHLSGYEVIKDYGDQAYGHCLHTWDDGERILAKCPKCGGYILIQQSEFHSFTDGDDSYYRDYFPVSGEEDADEMNQKYDGFALEESGIRYLIWDLPWYPAHWSK